MYSMMTYTLTELCDMANVTKRTVRYYIQLGLLASPESQGPKAAYSHQHLITLRAIGLLKERHYPLAKIRSLLEGASTNDIEEVSDSLTAPKSSASDYISGLLGRGVRPTEEPAVPPSPSRSSWERIALSNDIELHIRTPLSRDQKKIAKALAALAQSMQKKGGQP
jgi:DNA-binding transcriptional MerR regulator